jgi:hypothetical protein
VVELGDLLLQENQEVQVVEEVQVEQELQEEQVILLQ